MLLAPDVIGVLKASELSLDRVEDARNVLKVGDEIEVKVISVDRKNRTIGLSVKAKDIDEERSAVKEHKQKESRSPGSDDVRRSDQGADGSGSELIPTADRGVEHGPSFPTSTSILRLTFNCMKNKDFFVDGQNWL